MGVRMGLVLGYGIVEWCGEQQIVYLAARSVRLSPTSSVRKGTEQGDYLTVTVSSSSSVRKGTEQGVYLTVTVSSSS